MGEIFQQQAISPVESTENQAYSNIMHVGVTGCDNSPDLHNYLKPIRPG